MLLRVLLMLLAPISLSAGGVILYEIGSQDLGLASAGWSARAEDPSTAFTNPAGMSRIGCREIEFGVQPIYAHVNFEPNSSTTAIGSRGHANIWIPSGSTFYVEPINDCWTVGVSVLGYFGSKLKFNKGWVGRYYLTETILQGYSLVPAVSFKATKSLSFGLGANIMYGVFKQRSAVHNLLDGLDDGSLKLYDDDFGFGCVAGILYEYDNCTRLGLQYLSEVKLQFRSRPHFHNIGPTLQSFLAVTGVLTSKVLLDVNVPQGVMFSAYHQLFPCLAIMGNLGWQEWSKFQKATITLGSATDASLTQIPKYRNTWHAAIGAKLSCTNCLDLMAGFAYDSSAVKASDRPLDFPIGRQWRYGTGVEWRYDSTLSFGVQYEFQWQGNLHVDLNRGLLVGHVAGNYQSTYAHFINFNLQKVF